MSQIIIKDGSGNVIKTWEPVSKEALLQSIDALTAGHLTGSASLNFGSIASAASVEKTITVAGAKLGQGCAASPNGTPVAGLTWSAYVSAANTVTVRLSNFTASSVAANTLSWRADVWL